MAVPLWSTKLAETAKDVATVSMMAGVEKFIKRES
jgi:hypothetical protein